MTLVPRAYLFLLAGEPLYEEIMVSMTEAQPKPRPGAASLARLNLPSCAAVTLTRTFCNSLLARYHNAPLLPPKILHTHCLKFLLGHMT